MKKTILLSAFCFVLFAFSYSADDVSNASYLAEQGIISKQTVTSKYRLDDTITRAEVVGMALKIKGVELPNDYTCKNYFSDVRYTATNNWVCRAMEIGADEGIISKSNTRGRPSDTVTRTEALAMVMGAGGIETNEYSGGPFPFTDVDKNSWQYNLIGTAFKSDIVSESSCDLSQSARTCAGVSYGSFNPNRPATRAEVFGFGRKIGDTKNTNFRSSVFGLELTLPVGYLVLSNWYGEENATKAENITIRKKAEDYYLGKTLNIFYLLNNKNLDLKSVAENIFSLNQTTSPLREIFLDGHLAFEFSIIKSYTDNDGFFILGGEGSGKVVLTSRNNKILVFVFDADDILESIVYTSKLK